MEGAESESRLPWASGWRQRAGEGYRRGAREKRGKRDVRERERERKSDTHTRRVRGGSQGAG